MKLYQEWPVYASAYVFGAAAVAASDILADAFPESAIAGVAILLIVLVTALAAIYTGALHERGEFYGE